MRSTTFAKAAFGIADASRPRAPDALRHCARCGALRALLGVVGLFAVPMTLGAQRLESAIALSQSNLSSRRTIMALRVIGRPPVVDGDLSDAAWSTADVAADFTQVQPIPGAPARQRTEIRTVYDADAVYVAVRMFDSAPDSIRGQLTRRDTDGGNSDWARVIIDGYHDRRTAYEFAVNPRGVKVDARHYDDALSDLGWDAVWQVAVRHDSLGWTAEFRLPFSQLRYSRPRQGARQAVWGVQFLRDIARYNERDAWTPMPPDAAGFVSLFGDLRGMDAAKTPRNLGMTPYIMSRLTSAPADAQDPLHHATGVAAAFGGDVRYGVTSGLTLSLTANPDFGQVEADPAVVNLTAFETFFPEHRPFFVEGADIFNVNVANTQLFYSRRIGRAPQGGVPSDALFADTPEATTILGAAKLSGHTPRGWSLGLLSAVTRREERRFIDSLGVLRATTVEPLTNYTVGRAIRSFRNGQSAVGGVLTSVRREQTIAAGLQGLSASSTVAGIDGRHRFGDGAYEVQGGVVGTLVQGSTTAIAALQRAPAHYFQRPDAPGGYDSLATALSGVAIESRIDKIAGGHWRGGLEGRLLTRGYDVNDAGFFNTADLLVFNGYISYDEYHPSRVLRHWHAFANRWWNRNTAGDVLVGFSQVGVSFDTPSQWSGAFNYAHNFAGLDVTATRGGPALRVSSSDEFSGGLTSDRRRRLFASLNLNGSIEAQTGGTAASVSLGLTFRPTSRAEVSLTPGWSVQHNPWQYIATPKDAGGAAHYVFGQLNQTTASLTARLSYAVLPELTLELYAQPFVSAGTYTAFRRVADPRAPAFDARLPQYAPGEITLDTSQHVYRVAANPGEATGYAFGAPDFTARQFRSNVVIRWEYRPGSIVFIVWSQGRAESSSDGVIKFGPDFRRLFAAPATNTLAVKVTYSIAP